MRFRFLFVRFVLGWLPHYSLLSFLLSNESSPAVPLGCFFVLIWSATEWIRMLLQRAYPCWFRILAPSLLSRALKVMEYTMLGGITHIFHTRVNRSGMGTWHQDEIRFWLIVFNIISTHLSLKNRVQFIVTFSLVLFLKCFFLFLSFLFFSFLFLFFFFFFLYSVLCTNNF